LFFLFILVFLFNAHILLEKWQNTLFDTLFWKSTWSLSNYRV
jgi:hypothetical protein